MAQGRPEGAFAELIPELCDWNNGAGIDVDAWIGCVGNFEHAIGYSRIFWPEFEEHDGCVFWKGAFDEENYRSWLKGTAGDKIATQATMNHEHLVDLFADPDLRPTRKQLVYLGKILQDIWETKLNRDFPGARVSVNFDVDPPDDLRDYTITFFRDPKAAV